MVDNPRSYPERDITKYVRKMPERENARQDMYDPMTVGYLSTAPEAIEEIDGETTSIKSDSAVNRDTAAYLRYMARTDPAAIANMSQEERSLNAIAWAASRDAKR